ncbi:MAG: tol-pal system protein YbgF [Thermodesulfobacteriota bacterium]|nr:tol-pal system protein YbgF [Thermodesulfobacteriota bacterium]
MRSYRLLLVCLSMWFLLGGCLATTQNTRALDSRLDSLEQQAYKLKSEIDYVKKNGQTKRRDIREANATLKADFRTLREDIQQLRGEIESARYELTQHKKAFEQYKRERQNRLIALEKGPIDRITRMESYLGIEPPPDAAGDGQAAKSEAPETGTADSRATDVQDHGIEADATEDDIYSYAKQVFDLGDYAAAREGFETLLNRYPDSDKCDNARFWIGETYYREKWYEKAILEYQKVVDNYPDGNKVPAALLKQGMAFHQIGENMNARLVLKKLIEQYPDSNEAGLAQKKLDAF